MNNLWRKILLVILMQLYILNAYSSTENFYYFITPTQQQRFYQLISELRCLVCQNQSLAESNAPLAQDLKRIVSDQIRAGFTDEQIKQYLVLRYGEYILFKPSINQATFLLWAGPFLFLIGAFAIMFLSIRRQTKIPST